MDNCNGKKQEESRTETIHMIRPDHLNAAGRLFGGMLMQWIDELAGVVAVRHTGRECVTASVDNLKFIRGAYQGDLLVLIGKVTYTGSTSLEIRIDTYLESRDGNRHPINRAYLTMVAMDENDKPTKIPPLIIETIEQEAEWQAAQKRREIRFQRKKEGF